MRLIVILFLASISFIASQMEALAIIGGQTDEKDKFPYVVMLTYKDKSGKDITCSGTAVSKRIVITAAHCVINHEGRKLLPKEGFVSFFNGRSKFREIAIDNYYPDPNFKSTDIAHPNNGFEEGIGVTEHDFAYVVLSEDAPINKFPLTLDAILDKEIVGSLLKRKPIDEMLNAIGDQIGYRVEGKFDASSISATIVGFGVVKCDDINARVNCVGAGIRRYTSGRIIHVNRCMLGKRLDLGGDFWCFDTPGGQNRQGGMPGDSGGPLLVLVGSSYVVLGSYNGDQPLSKSGYSSYLTRPDFLNLIVRSR